MSKEEGNIFQSAAWNTFNDEYEGSGIEENFGPELESDKIKVSLISTLKNMIEYSIITLQKVH